MVWERQTDGDEDRLLYWPIHSFSLDHNTLCYLHGLSFSLSTRRTQPLSARALFGPLRPRFSIYRLNWLLQAETDFKLRPPLSHLGICIYHFITPTHFPLTTWLLPLIFTGASCAENLWLTARSRVNMKTTVVGALGTVTKDVRKDRWNWKSE